MAKVGWVEWDVTSDVAAFLAGTAVNHGLVVKNYVETQSGHADFFPPGKPA